MRIGINATFLNEKPTGVCVFARELSRSFVKLHNDTVVFSPFEDPGLPEECFYKVPRRVAGSTQILNSLCRMLYVNTVLPVLCRVKHVDVLYCPITEFPFSPLVPLVVHVHDLHPVHFPSEFGLGAQRFRFSLQHLHRLAKRVIVSSQYMRDELLAYAHIGEDLIDVVPLAFNRHVYKPQKPECKSALLNKYAFNDKFILFVGSLYPYKNVQTLIEAFRKIRHKIPHDLVIIGRKSFAGGTLPRDERIHYADYVPVEDLPLFYSYADVFVHPSISEGFGLAPLEAMASGAPVISSNGGSLPEVINDAGILFDPRDRDSLSESIMKVVTDRTLRSGLIEKGFRNVERFSWERTAAGILKSCERAFSGK